jgi:hypothetical protein
MLHFIFYILLCLLVGVLARKQPLGFFGYTIIAFFITPFGGFVLLLFMMLYTKLAVRGIEKRKKKKLETLETLK